MIIGIGIDIVEVKRIQKAIDRWGKNFLNQIFTPQEIDYAQKHKNPTMHFAARFAAKEAIYKAAGRKDLSWKDVTILNDADGKPYCIVHKKSFKHKIFISLSHTKTYAAANALITR
jgi:holo-[acyl-carrier protein] synthase